MQQKDALSPAPLLVQGHVPHEGGALLFYKRASFPGSTKPEWFFCTGYRSDTMGVKAAFLWELAQRTQTNCTLFDYVGCGQSSGSFEKATIGDWKASALCVLDQVTQGPQVLIGSSMGAWIMLLVMRERRERVVRMVGIGSAPDFTEELFYKKLTPEGKKALQETGSAQLPRATSVLELSLCKVEEGRKHLVFGTPLEAPCPTFLLHGLADDVVPWSHSQRLLEHLKAPFSSLLLIKDGDHSLARPEDLDLLKRLIQEA